MIETIKNTWNETMEIPEARWIFWLTILVIAVTVAIYFAKMFRDMATGRNVATEDMLSNFERLRSEGKLDEEEYTKLKTTIRESQAEQEVSSEEPKNEQ